MKKVHAILLGAVLVCLPFVVGAQETEEAANVAVTLTNPLGEEDVRVIIGRVIQGALSISGTLALLMFVYGGFLWLTDMGRGEQVKKGKDVLVWSTLGILLIAGAYVLTSAIFNAFTTGALSA